MSFRSSLLLAMMMMIATSSALLPAEDFETVRTSNAAILNRLGLVPLPDPDSSGHHRKRLAPESSARVHQSSFGRRHSTNSNNHDSHVYVVKLPASPPYYSFTKPGKDKANMTVANPDFKNNGKPAKIYHWNLPLVKKMNEKRKQMALLKLEQARKKLEAERERQKVADKMNYLKKLAQEQLVAESGLRKPSRNNDKWLSEPEKVETRPKTSDSATQMKILSSKTSNSPNKIYRLDDSIEERSNNNHHHNHHLDNWPHPNSSSSSSNDLPRAKKHKKKSAGVSYYYAPAHHHGKSASTSISKHFSGNGKPKAFYVMEKSRKPAYYHPLMP